MRFTKNKWFGAGKWMGVCLIGIAMASIVHAQAFSTTTVQGTVYLADGTPGAGTLQLSWPAFTTAGNQAVAAGRTTVAIGADGFVSVNLAPNLGSMPGGLYYTAVYYMSDGTTGTEYWVVPVAAQTTIAQVRAQVMPAAQAVHAVNKAYVDQAIQSLSQTYLAPSGGSLSGPLFLNGDPTQALQAADKHYVDSQFNMSVPMTGANMTGPLTSVKLGAAYQADQFSGADFGAQLQACLAALSPVNGGTCDARNFTGNQSMSSNLTISTANTTVLLPCATISTASQVIVTAGTRNVALRGCALRGASNASGSQGGTVFLYSGTAAMIQVGDPTYTADTMGFHLDNAVINTTASTHSTAQALVAYRTQEMDLQSLYLLGNSNQTGMTLDGTGNYTGGTFYDNAFNGFQTAVNAIGHQVSNSASTDWLNASTFLRLHIDCPTSSGYPISGTYGINLQQGDGNTFTGGDVEGCDTALHLGPNAQNNTIVGLRNENSNSQVMADAGSSYNNWITGGTMFTGKLADNGTRNSFLDAFHRSFNGLNGDWYGSQQDATITNHYRIGIGAGNERGLLNRYQTDSGYRWTTGLSDATAGEQFYQVLDELNNVYRLSIGQYNTGQPSSNNQTVINAAGTGAVVLNGSNNSGTGGVVIGSGGAAEATVATINHAGNAQFNGTLQVGGSSTFNGSTTMRNQADAEIDSFLWAGATTNQKESLTYKDYAGASQWYMVKDASNNWALNSATGGLDSFKAYQSTNSGDTYINASNPSGLVRVNYENGAGTGFNIYGGNSSTLYAGFTGATSIKFPGLAAGTGHNCLQIDDSGYITNTGLACGTGSGSGTVNSGATGQIAYYSGSGTALSGMSAVPVTSGGTGANSAAAALTSLGAASLASAATQTFAGPINFGSPSIASASLANLGGQAAVPGLSSDGSNGITVAGTITAGAIRQVQGGTLTSATALLPFGGTLIVGGTLTVGTSISTPTNIKLEIKNGAGFSISSGAILSLNSPLEAGPYTIFTGAGTVSFSGNRFLREIKPEWWGADGSGVSDSTVAWQAAATAAGNVGGFGGLISCPAAVYNISNTIASFSSDTAHGISLIGPEGQMNNASGSCSLRWTGVAGGTMWHYLGGHQGKIANVIFNFNGLAGRGLWLDTAQGSVASTSVSAIARASNVVTVTLASAETWPSGTNTILSGVSDTSFNGIFPVWYQTDSTHISWSQSGPDGSSSGGAIQTAVGGDTAGLLVQRNHFFTSTQTGTSISSASITGSVLSVTLAAPQIVYPNQWVWITGSSDPVYNAYWQVLTVTSPTTFTAQSTEVSSEASTTSGTFYPSTTGITIGPNSLAQVNASVCCLNIEKNGFVGPYASGPTPWTLFGIEVDGRSNTKDFTSRDNNFTALRIAWMSPQSGTFISDGDNGSAIIDALYATSVNGTVVIRNGEWEPLGGGQYDHPYILGSMPSGSYQAATKGPNGQFELNNGANQGATLEIANNSFELGQYATDGVAVSTGAALTLKNNGLGEQYSNTSVPIINVSTYYNSTSASQSVVSEGNTYGNVAAGSFAPITDGAAAAYGPGSRSGGVPVRSMFDKGLTNSKATIVPLGNGDTLTVLKYIPLLTGAPPVDANLGFVQLPNNVAGMCWENAAGTGSDCINANASNQLVFSNSSPSSSFVVAPTPLTGTTGSIGGSALAAGACATGTVTITGATTSMVANASPVTYPGDGNTWESYVSSSGTVTVKVCAIVAGTPTASAYNVRVIQ